MPQPGYAGVASAAAVCHNLHGVTLELSAIWEGKASNSLTLDQNGCV